MTASRRRPAILAVALLIILLLSGCGGGSGTTTNQAPDNGGPGGPDGPTQNFITIHNVTVALERAGDFIEAGFRPEYAAGSYGQPVTSMRAFSGTRNVQMALGGAPGLGEYPIHPQSDMAAGRAHVLWVPNTATPASCHANGGTVTVEHYDAPGGQITGTIRVTSIFSSAANGGQCPAASASAPVLGRFSLRRAADPLPPPPPPMPDNNLLTIGGLAFVDEDDLFNNASAQLRRTAYPPRTHIAAGQLYTQATLEIFTETDGLGATGVWPIASGQGFGQARMNWLVSSSDATAGFPDGACSVTGGTVTVGEYGPVGGRISGTLAITGLEYTGATDGGGVPLGACPPASVDAPLVGAFDFKRAADNVFGNDASGTDTMTVNRSLLGGPTPDYPLTTVATESAGTLYESLIWARYAPPPPSSGINGMTTLFLGALKPTGAASERLDLVIQFPGPPAVGTRFAWVIEDGFNCWIDGTVTLTRADGPGGIVEGTFTGNDVVHDPDFCPVTAYNIAFRVKREANLVD